MDLLKIKADQILQEKNHQLILLTTFPEISDSISLNNFIASITQTVSPTEISVPTSTKFGLSGEGFL